MRVIFLLLLSVVSLAARTQSKAVTAESSIQNVIVFSSGAQVQRAATVALAAGRTEIVFPGLSNQLEQQSLQLKADANVTLLSVQVMKDFTGQRRIDQEERALIDRRAALLEKIEMDQKVLQVYKHEEEMLVKNQAIGGQAGVKTEELKQALDLQRQRLNEIYLKQLETERRIKAQQQEYNKMGLQLGETGKKRDSISYSVVVLIESKETRPVKFQLLYTVKDAGWYPTYDVRVNEVNQPLTLLMNAHVFQRSGETWKDVSLQLSTGNPKDNATPSKLQPWMLGYYDPSIAWMRNQAVRPGEVAGRVTNAQGEPVAFATVMIKGTRLATTADANGYFKLISMPSNGVVQISAAGFAMKELAATQGYYSIVLDRSQAMQEVVVTGLGVSRDSDFEPARRQKKEEEIQTVSIQTEYQPTTTVYKIEDRYTLETDGKTTTIGIRQIPVPALYEYYSAPKVEPSVYLTAKIVNWEEYELQSGEANLYFEGTYLGKTYIDLSAASDTLSLSLGKDNNVRISRKLLKEFSSQRLIGSNKTETRQYEITVRNTKKTAVTILVQDQFPVPVNKDIQVNDVEAPEGQADKETGIVTWTLALQPGQEKKLQLSYSVKYPKDRKVVLE
ncbi:MAG TPA: mucoidy inhibitor MuiA family protein [Flavisolibacter sp.]